MNEIQLIFNNIKNLKVPVSHNFDKELYDEYLHFPYVDLNVPMYNYNTTDEGSDNCPSQYNFFFDGWNLQGSLFSYCKDANGKLLFDSNQIDLDTSETAINAVRNFVSATPQDSEYVSADVASVNGVPCFAVESLNENDRFIQVVHDGTLFAFSVIIESDTDTGNYKVIISTLSPN